MHSPFRDPKSYLDDTVQTLVIVDYSNLLYRAWFVSSSRAWVAHSKFFDMLRLCVKRSKQEGVPLKVIFAGESKSKLERAKVYKDYKGNRKGGVDPKFQNFKQELAELLRFIGWEIVSVEGWEADDVIASIVEKYCGNPEKYHTDIVIFSGDRDLQQCLSKPRTTIYRAPGLFVTRESFEAEYSFPAAEYGLYKALTGDKSDNIKGVEGFGPAKAKIAIIAKSIESDIWEMRGQAGVDEFIFSKNLLDLNRGLDIDLDKLYLGPPKFDDKSFLARYKKPHEGNILFELKRLEVEF